MRFSPRPARPKVPGTGLACSCPRSTASRLSLNLAGSLPTSVLVPSFHRNRALRVGTHGEAWDAECRGFLLEPAGIRHDEPGLDCQGEEVEISQRRQQAQRPVCRPFKSP